VIGSIRREFLDHVIVFHESSLRRTLASYFQYYHRSRTHLSLEKDSPEPRSIQPSGNGASRGGAADGRTTSPLRTTGRLKSPISHTLRPEQSFKSGPKSALVHRRPPARSRTATNIGNRGRKFAEKTICPGPDGIFIRHRRFSSM
jgi:hypothetical protein